MLKSRDQLWWTLSPLLATISCGYLAWRNGRRTLAIAQLTTSTTGAAVAATIATSGPWAAALTSPYILTAIVATMIANAATAAWAAAAQSADSRIWHSGPAQRTVAHTGCAAAIIAAATFALSTTWVIAPQIRVARSTFVNAPVAEPHPLETTTTSTAATTPTPGVPHEIIQLTTTTPAPTTTLADTTGRLNVLLLGGDAGQGRTGLRADSVNVISIDLTTGDAAIIGIPRNLKNAPMPPGELRTAFPDGFPELFNALHKWGTNHPDVVTRALGPTDNPGASITAAATAELLGIRIDAWVLIDMAAFIHIIDAVDGVDVYVPKRVPAAGNIPEGKHPLEAYFEPGWQHMDGTDALSYARSRHADSDYGRMSRQRCLLASIAAQNTATKLATAWPTLSRIISERVRTNLTGDHLDAIIKLAGTDLGNTRSIALTPPQVPANGWDPAYVRALVAQALAATPTNIPPTPTEPGTTTATTAPPATPALPTVATTCQTINPNS